MPSYEVHRIEDTALIKSEWNRLAERDSSATLFQRWEWNQAWWENLGKHQGTACVLSVTEGPEKTLKGIAPFCLIEKRSPVGRIRILEFFGGRFFDYQGILAEDVHRKGVSEAVADWLGRGEVGWDLGDFRHMVRQSDSAREFQAALERLPFPLRIKEEGKAPYSVLNPEKTLMEHVPDSGFAEYLKRKMKKIRKDFEVGFSTAAGPEELQRGFPGFVSLNRMRSKDKLQQGIFRNQSVEGMIFDVSERFLQANILRFHTLTLNRRPAAFLLNFAYRGRTYFYQSGFDLDFRKYSTGLVVHALAMEVALNEKIREYDWLIGEEEYKFQWTKCFRTIDRFRLVRSMGKNRILDTQERFERTLRNAVFLKKTYFRMQEIKTRILHGKGA
jgi:CelD/BcsL family acetyltransferase involved in cellulose biosynthesis